MKSIAVFERQIDKNIRPWSKWVWDPITGCQYDCSYCHAIEKVRKLYSRTRDGAYSSFRPHLWLERFDAPHSTPIPRHSAPGNRNVLVGSMGDIFGDWVGSEHLEAILDIVRETPQWNYIFLTKNPKRYLEFEIPLNCWVGVKIDEQKEVKPAIRCFNHLQASVRFVSCDPMVVWLFFPSLACFDWIIIGPRPKTRRRPAFNPPKMWISSIAKQARESDCKVFVKHLKDPGYRKFPGYDRH